jgi:hypothetical protein
VFRLLPLQRQKAKHSPDVFTVANEQHDVASFRGFRQLDEFFIFLKSLKLRCICDVLFTPLHGVKNVLVFALLSFVPIFACSLLLGNQTKNKVLDFFFEIFEHFGVKRVSLFHTCL